MTTEQPTNPESEPTGASEHTSAEPAPVEAAPDSATHPQPTPAGGLHRAVEDLEDLPAQEAQDIASHSIEGRVRRAPKMGPFFFVGAILGIALGLVLGFWLSEPEMEKRGIYIAVSVVFVTTIVELIVGGLVVYLDKRSQAAQEQ